MKVKTSPNTKFATISDIQWAQLAAEKASNAQRDEEEANESDSTLDCIEIE